MAPMRQSWVRVLADIGPTRTTRGTGVGCTPWAGRTLRAGREARREEGRREEGRQEQGQDQWKREEQE